MEQKKREYGWKKTLTRYEITWLQILVEYELLKRIEKGYADGDKYERETVETLKSLNDKLQFENFTKMPW